MRASARGRIASVAALGAIALLVSGCPRAHPRAHEPTPAPGAQVDAGPAVRSDAVVEPARGDAGPRLVDRARALEITFPPGWELTTSFQAGPAGPPPLGDLRVRATLGSASGPGGRPVGPGCVIDVALGPALEARELPAAIAAGREVFYFAKTDFPSPEHLEAKAIYTATLIAGRAATTDVGYWIARAGDAGASGGETIRIEGRFPSDRLPECKDALDAVVTSMSAPHADAGAASPRTSHAASP